MRIHTGFTHCWLKVEFSVKCQLWSLICQPQERNTHGRIFGGFLMRKAFEPALSNAYAFAGASPRFIEVDHVDFVKPVSNKFYLIIVRPEAIIDRLRLHLSIVVRIVRFTI